MSNINLLPEELRKKEDAERQAAPKPSSSPFIWREPTLAGAPPAKPTPPPAPPRQPLTPQSPIARPIPVQAPAAAGGVRHSFISRISSIWSALRTRFSFRKNTGASGGTQGSGSGLTVNLLGKMIAGARRPLVSATHVVSVVVITLGIALIIVVGGWLGLRALADERVLRLTTVTTKLAEEKQKLSVLSATMRDIANFSERLVAVKKLLDNHIGTVPLLDFLERDTLSTVQLTDVTMRPDDGRIALGALAPDIPSIAAQLVHWAERKDIIRSLEVSAVTRQERAEFAGPVYVMNIVLLLTPEALHPYAPSISQ